jgi:hypothetical protein
MPVLLTAHTDENGIHDVTAGGHRQARHAARRNHWTHGPLGPGQQRDLAVPRTRHGPVLRRDRAPAPARIRDSRHTPADPDDGGEHGAEPHEEKEPAGAGTR